MSSELGTRNIGDIVGDTFGIYLDNFLKLLGIVAIVGLPWAILGVLFSLRIAEVFDPFSIGDIGPLIASIMEMAIFIVIFVAVSIVALTLMTGAVIHAISEQYVRQTIDIGQAYRFAWKRLRAMIGATVLAILACLGMAITIVGIPAAIYFIFRWAFVTQAALLEGLGPRAALSRSSALVKGNWLRVAGIMFVMAIIGAVVSSIFGLMPEVGGIIAPVLSMPITIIGGTLLYYDLRVRKEGYNLEALASEINIKIDSNVA